MAEKILVALKGRDRIQEIIPILQKIAKPGMTVTFLVRYPADSWAWLRDHWIATESSRKAMLEGKRMMAKYAWYEQRRLAERRISEAREALEKIGVEVALVIKGCFRKAVRSYALGGEFQFILVTAGSGDTMMGLARLTILLLRRIKQPGFSSFHLYHPRPRAHREESTVSV